MEGRVYFYKLERYLMNYADTAFILICTMFVFFMTPGLAIFYGGLVRRRNVVGLMEQSYIAIGVVGILWMLFGFSLAFGNDIGGVIGDMAYVFMKGVSVEPNGDIAPNIPFVLYFVFQLAFAVITPALISGAVAERMNFKAYTIFIGLWSIFVYSPAAHLVWGGGFFAKMGVLDFAGGLVIHLTAGVSAFAAAMYVGARKNEDYTPCNMAYVSIGAGILWAGWFAFNGGSALAANGTASLAVANTLLASAWALFGWLLLKRLSGAKATLLDTLLGGIAGLVVITPMAGYVEPWCTIPVGLAGAFMCSSAIRLRTALHLDDTLDVWALHGVGGATGVILGGVFACGDLAPSSGALYGNMAQLGVQALAVLCIAAFSFIMTMLLLKVTDCVTPVRMSEHDETAGLDLTAHGELLYYRK